MHCWGKAVHRRIKSGGQGKAFVAVRLGVCEGGGEDLACIRHLCTGKSRPKKQDMHYII